MQHGNSRLLRRFTQTFTLVYPKQHLKFAMGTTKNKSHRNDTELSKEYWKGKQQNGIPIINWKVLTKCYAYIQKKGQFALCLNEK